MRTRHSVATVHAALVAALGLAGFDCSGGSKSSCVDPTPIMVDGRDTGFDQCKGGPRRRREALDCPIAPAPNGGSCPVDAGTLQCRSNGDCAEHPNGQCIFTSNELGPSCGCFYPCLRDSDCPSGEICSCASIGGICQQATCTSGASCPNGECVEYTSHPGCPATAFACSTPSDDCFSDSDCNGGMCTVENGHRVCQSPRCSVGRPFFVDGEARLPAVVARDDWREALAPRASSVDDATRARLARAWTRIGQMEHASIAAFARFTLQLLAVGAPPDLVIASQEAMADETRHARLAFGLASAYAGASIGPGPLAIDACLDACDLDELIATTVREGCIGETVAAIEAREALVHAQDREVRAVLETIAHDETRHAALAWRTVAWAIEAGGAKARATFERTLREAIDEAAGTSCDGDDLLAHGVVGDGLRAELRRAAIVSIVAPCAEGIAGRRQADRARPAQPAAQARAHAPEGRHAS